MTLLFLLIMMTGIEVCFVLGIIQDSQLLLDCVAIAAVTLCFREWEVSLATFPQFYLWFLNKVLLG